MLLSPFIAVDVGNSRIKFGLFASGRSDEALPSPAEVFELSVDAFDPHDLDAWLAKTMGRVNVAPVWWIASVNRAPTNLLTAWLAKRRAVPFDPQARKMSSPACESPSEGAYCLLQHSDLPLAVALPEPKRVGIDRLVGAVAANRLRASQRPAIIIGVGSAITVDLVSSEGVFLGGAILPGIGMSARAMHEFTDQLPLVAYEELADAPPALGTATVEAMRAGLYWGAVGAMKELVARLSILVAQRSTTAESLRVIDPDFDTSLRQGESTIGETRPRETLDVFLTGGAAPTVAEFLDPRARYIRHLRLGGIAVVAQL